MPLNIPSDKLSKEITDKYSIVSNTFVQTVKDDKQDFLETEIGDIKQADFKPQIKIKRWDNEVNFSARLIDNEIEEPVISSDDEKIIWSKSKKDINFYDLPVSDEYPEGGYEFEIILKEKPDTNKIEFTIQNKGLEFFYQPALTQEEIDNGINRPENVVGSYAVYYKDCPANYVGGKLYRCGKAFHIYRPRIEDAEGNRTWGELNIDEEKGILSVTIPQEFLDNAIYPVRHAAGLTFGYNETPLTDGGYGAQSYINGSLFTSPSNIATATSMSVYGDVRSYNLKMLVVLHSNLNIISNGITPDQYFNGLKWNSKGFSTPPSLSVSTEYVLCWITSGTNNFYYDTGSTDQGHFDYSNSYTTPTDPTDATHSTKRWGIYCTYTPSSTNVTVIPTVQSATFSTRNPVITAVRNIAITATVLSALFSIQTPTVTASNGNVNVQPTVQSATFSTPSPTITTIRNTSVSVNALTANFNIPDVSVIANVNCIISASVSTAQFSLPDPTITAIENATISVSVISSDFSVQNPIINTVRNVSISPSIQSSTFSIPTPVITAVRNINISVSAVTANFSLPTATISSTKNITISATVQEFTYSIQNPTILAIRNVSINATVQTANFSIPTPTITAIRNTTFSATALSLNFSIPPVVVVIVINYNNAGYTYSSSSVEYGGQIVSNDAYVSASVFTATFTIPNPTISAIRNTTILPNVVSSTFTVLDPFISLATNVTINANVVSATFSLNNPTITIIENATISINTLLVNFLIPVPTISTVRNTSIPVNVLPLTFTILTPRVSIMDGIWEIEQKHQANWMEEAKHTTIWTVIS